MLSSNQIAGFCKVQYLVKEAGNKVDFLNGDKHQCSQQVFFVGCELSCPEIPKVQSMTNLKFDRINLLYFLDFLDANGPEREL